MYIVKNPEFVIVIVHSSVPPRWVWLAVPGQDVCISNMHAHTHTHTHAWSRCTDASYIVHSTLNQCPPLRDNPHQPIDHEHQVQLIISCHYNSS